MSVREVWLRIRGEDYGILPLYRVPVERRGQAGAPQGVLAGCADDPVCMARLRAFVAEADPSSAGGASGGDRQMLAAAARLLHGPARVAILVRRRDAMRPNSTRSVLDWIQLALASGEDPYSFLSRARNQKGADKLDDNLAAAERYFEGYDGNYSAPLIAGSFLLKSAREVSVGGLRPFEAILGRNGSQSPEFVTRWGMLGVFDRENGISAAERVRRGESGARP